ncbi:hypothetical protein BH20ACT18_BH20ACT18_03460 [soil metagenome]
MSMADRNNPKRGLASRSDYSLMAFTRELPDDAACPTFGASAGGLRKNALA